MSWAEVMKVNGDMGNPLNLLLALNDYKTYGVNSYAFQTKKIWDTLRHSELALYDLSLTQTCWDWWLKDGYTEVGLLNHLLGGMFGGFQSTLEICGTAEGLGLIGSDRRALVLFSRVSALRDKVDGSAQKVSRSFNCTTAQEFPDLVYLKYVYNGKVKGSANGGPCDREGRWAGTDALACAGSTIQNSSYPGKVIEGLTFTPATTDGMSVNSMSNASVIYTPLV